MSEQDNTCFVCQKGLIHRGKRFFRETDSFFECDYCHSEFQRDGKKFLFKKIPDTSSWKKYDGQTLTREEIKRIRQGGLSDTEIVQKKAASDAEIAQKKAAEEELKRREQQPGTPENYRMRFREILGLTENDTEFALEVTAKSAEEVKQYIKQFGQLQKELRQLRKEITATKRDVRATYSTRKVQLNANFTYSGSRFGASHRAREKERLDVLRDTELGPYDDIIAEIDSAVLNFDKFKIEIENQSSGLSINIKPAHSKPRTAKAKERPEDEAPETDVTLESLLDELNGLVGLNSAKAEVQELVNFLKVQQVRKDRGMPVAGLSLHVVFYGNPGTGKTMVARLLSKIYRALGVLSKGQLVETDRSGMVAGYVGQTALKVADVVEQSLGGVLFIDEAYSLADNDESGYGREAIDTLIKLMEDHREDLAVVIAGYTDKIEGFLSTNPGLKSRFNRYWKFDDYSPPEMLSIFESFCTKGHFQLSTSAKDKLKVVLQTAYEQRDESFGNARLVRNLYEASISNQASRIVSYKQISDEALITVEAKDIPDAADALQE